MFLFKNTSKISHSFFGSTTFTLTFHQVPHKIFKGFPPSEIRSSQEPPFKNIKAIGSREWAHLYFKRRKISQRFVGIFKNSFLEQEFTQLRAYF